MSSEPTTQEVQDAIDQEAKDLKRKRDDSGDKTSPKKLKDDAPTPPKNPLVRSVTNAPVRSKSIETIKKKSPEKVMKVCLDRVSQMLQQDSVDYKTVRHWLQLADKMAKESDKMEELVESVEHIRTSHSTNKTLLAVIWWP